AEGPPGPARGRTGSGTDRTGDGPDRGRTGPGTDRTVHGPATSVTPAGASGPGAAPGPRLTGTRPALNFPPPPPPPASGKSLAQCLQRARPGVVGRGAVADDEAVHRGVGGVGMAEAPEAEHPEALPCRGPDHRLLGAGRKPEDGMQPRRDAGDPDVGGPGGQRLDQGVAAAAVAQAGRADVAVVGAGGEELGERQ